MGATETHLQYTSAEPEDGPLDLVKETWVRPQQHLKELSMCVYSVPNWLVSYDYDDYD